MKAIKLLYNQLLTNPHIETRVKDILKQSMVIEATHVSDYFFEGDKDLWNFDDFPNVAPPFENFFLEFQAPPYEMRGGIKHDWHKTSPSQWGMLCYSAPFEKGWTYKFMIFAKFNAGVSPIPWNLGPHVGWQLNIKPDGSFFKKQDGAVEVLTTLEGHMAKIFNTNSQFTTEMAHKIYEEFKKHIWVTFLTICFMHCKNVTLIKQESLPAKKQTAKQKRWKLPEQPQVTYHILDIEPMKQVLKTEGQSEQTGLQRALHICRGHFSTYTEDHKLFGKYAGTFWIPQHVRGTVKAGVALKDYRIKIKS